MKTDKKGHAIAKKPGFKLASLQTFHATKKTFDIASVGDIVTCNGECGRRVYEVLWAMYGPWRHLFFLLAGLEKGGW